MTFKPFSATHVEYDSDDGLVGKVMALLSLAPVFIVVGYVSAGICAFACASAARRNSNTGKAADAIVQGIAALGACFSGQLLNVGVNLVIKAVVKEPRPPRPFGATPMQTEGGFSLGGSGMPSNHAQFMFYIAAIAFFRHQSGAFPPPFGRASKRTVALVGQLLLWTAAAAVAYSRVFLVYHTVQQVCAGAFAGVVFAAVWEWSGGFEAAQRAVSAACNARVLADEPSKDD